MQIAAGFGDAGFNLFQSGLRFGPFGFENIKGGRSTLQARPCASQIGPSAGIIGLGLINALTRAIIIGHQFLCAFEIGGTANNLAFGSPHLGFGLRDHRLLGLHLVADTADHRLLRRQTRFRRLQSKAVVTLVDQSQHITRFDQLIISDRHRNHIAGHFGGNHRHIGPHIGIIGGDHKPPFHQIAEQSPEAVKAEHGGDPEQDQLFPALAGRFLTALGWSFWRLNSC